MDRNIFGFGFTFCQVLSLSARRAWIEIEICVLKKETGPIVALRKESVDRNMLYDTSSLMKCQSLSARRAWIEMLMKCQVKKYSGSLSARRAWIEMCCGWKQVIY